MDGLVWAFGRTSFAFRKKKVSYACAWEHGAQMIPYIWSHVSVEPLNRWASPEIEEYNSYYRGSRGLCKKTLGLMI